MELEGMHFGGGVNGNVTISDSHFRLGVVPAASLHYFAVNGHRGRTPASCWAHKLMDAIQWRSRVACNVTDCSRIQPLDVGLRELLIIVEAERAFDANDMAETFEEGKQKFRRIKKDWGSLTFRFSFCDKNNIVKMKHSINNQYTRVQEIKFKFKEAL